MPTTAYQRKASKRSGDSIMSTSLSISQLLLLLIVAASTPVSANKGWNPCINYTLWANNESFLVGDLTSFRYQKIQYNVFEVNQTEYDIWSTEGAVRNWSSRKNFIFLDKPKRYYFICGTGGCFKGMKVSVVVHPLPPTPTSAVAAAHSNTKSATSMPAPGVWVVIVGVVMSFLGFSL